MKLISDENLFVIRETLHRLGVGGVVKLLLVMGLIVWLFWPAEEEPQVATTSPQALQREPLPPPATESEDNLYSKMTSEQSLFYWESFQWMMNHGPKLKPKSFRSNTVFVSFLKDEPFQADNGLTCVPYSEKLIRMGKFNVRRGVACQRSGGSWCRQPENETAQCRIPRDGGLGVVSTEADITLHNMQIDWDRNLRDFGF